ncbi:hypothetical protein BHE74_00009892 [Ensete ventricosum]|nr:hypothetical protein BHE74_00009892 [Ensete ventricosum]
MESVSTFVNRQRPTPTDATNFHELALATAWGFHGDEVPTVGYKAERGGTLGSCWPRHKIWWPAERHRRRHHQLRRQLWRWMEGADTRDLEHVNKGRHDAVLRRRDEIVEIRKAQRRRELLRHLSRRNPRSIDGSMKEGKRMRRNSIPNWELAGPQEIGNKQNI